MRTLSFSSFQTKAARAHACTKGTFGLDRLAQGDRVKAASWNKQPAYLWHAQSFPRKRQSKSLGHILHVDVGKREVYDTLRMLDIPMGALATATKSPQTDLH